jgi:hypothetical protein
LAALAAAVEVWAAGMPAMPKANNATTKHEVFIRLTCFFPTTSFLTPLPEIHQELYFHFVKFSLKDFPAASVFLYLASIFMPLLKVVSRDDFKDKQKPHFV